MNNDKTAPAVKTFANQSALMVVWAGVLAYTVVFTVISLLRYEAFSFDDFDFAMFTHEAWKALHGSGHISMFNDIPIWGNALELISFLTVPLYGLFGGDPRGLLFWQSLVLGAGAIPVFLIARPRMPEPMAVAFAFSYLFYPPLWYSNLYEYYPIVFATFTLLMAFYFYDQKRFGWFMLFIVLSFVNRVDVGVVTGMYGVYALFSGRSWKWVLWPSLLSAFWVFVGLFVIIPHFNHNIYHDAHYSQFGKGFGQIIKNMILHPELLRKSLMTATNEKYFIELLAPVGFLSLAGPKEFLLCSLSLFQHLVSKRAYEHTIYYHYTATITPFVYISAIQGLAWIKGKRNLNWVIWCLPVALSVYTNLLYGPMSKPKDYLAQVKVDAEDVYKKQLLAEIPRNAPAVSSFEFSPMLAGRNRYYSFHFIYDGRFLNNKPYKTPTDIEYALINFDDPRMLSFERDQTYENVQKFVAGGPFGIVDRINGIVLFKKGYQSSMRLFEVLPADPAKPPLLDLEKNIKLVKADYALHKKRGLDVLSVVYAWTLAAPVGNKLVLYMMFADEKGNVVHTVTRSICYGAIPTYVWKPGEEYVDTFDLLLPSNLKSGEYGLYLAVFVEGTSHFLKINRYGGDGQLVEANNNSMMVHKFRQP